jgi:hypothetical protein
MQDPGQPQPLPRAAPPRGEQSPIVPEPPAELWGAIAFTVDGSYSSVWKAPSKAQAEAYVAVKCAEFGRGKCKVVSFQGHLCIGLANFRGRRYRATYTAGGLTATEAQKAALERCNADKRTRGGCGLRTVFCGDGR